MRSLEMSKHVQVLKTRSFMLAIIAFYLNIFSLLCGICFSTAYFALLLIARFCDVYTGFE